MDPPEHGFYMKGFSNKDDKIKHGEKIRYGCNATYTLVGNSTQECNDGRWTNSTPSCKGLTVLLPKNCWPSCHIFLKLKSWCCNLRNFLSKKRSQNDFWQLTLWLLSMKSQIYDWFFRIIMIIIQTYLYRIAASVSRKNCYQCRCCKKLKLKVKKLKIWMKIKLQ